MPVDERTTKFYHVIYKPYKKVEGVPFTNETREEEMASPTDEKRDPEIQPLKGARPFDLGTQREIRARYTERRYLRGLVAAALSIL